MSESQSIESSRHPCARPPLCSYGDIRTENLPTNVTGPKDLRSVTKIPQGRSSKRPQCDSRSPDWLKMKTLRPSMNWSATKDRQLHAKGNRRGVFGLARVLNIISPRKSGEPDLRGKPGHRAQPSHRAGLQPPGSFHIIASQLPCVGRKLRPQQTWVHSEGNRGCISWPLSGPSEPPCRTAAIDRSCTTCAARGRSGSSVTADKPVRVKAAGRP
jgi:hypothetical protein